MKLSKPEDMDELEAESGESESSGDDGPVTVLDPVSGREVPVSEALESLLGQMYSEVNRLSDRMDELEADVRE